jgi:hypothetical protein
MSPDANSQTATHLQLFDITYVTREVDLTGRSAASVKTGLVCYQVFAADAEDAIRRLREQEPARHPVVEIAAVQPAHPLPDGGVRGAEFTIFPREMRENAAGLLSRVLARDN